MKRRLYKNESDRMICGVCSGIAEFFGMPVWLVRVIWLVLMFGWGLSLWVYIVCAIIMPSKAQVMAQQAHEENRGFGPEKPPFDGGGFDTSHAKDVDAHPAGEAKAYDMPPKREYDPARVRQQPQEPERDCGCEDMRFDNTASDARHGTSNAVYDEEEFYRQSRKTSDEEFK